MGPGDPRARKAQTDERERPPPRAPLCGLGEALSVCEPGSLEADGHSDAHPHLLPRGGLASQLELILFKFLLTQQIRSLAVLGPRNSKPRRQRAMCLGGPWRWGLRAIPASLGLRPRPSSLCPSRGLLLRASVPHAPASPGGQVMAFRTHPGNPGSASLKNLHLTACFAEKVLVTCLPFTVTGSAG